MGPLMSSGATIGSHKCSMRNRWTANQRYPAASAAAIGIAILILSSKPSNEAASPVKNTTSTEHHRGAGRIEESSRRLTKAVAAISTPLRSMPSAVENTVLKCSTCSACAASAYPTNTAFPLNLF